MNAPHLGRDDAIRTALGIPTFDIILSVIADRMLQEDTTRSAQREADTLLLGPRVATDLHYENKLGAIGTIEFLMLDSEEW